MTTSPTSRSPLLTESERLILDMIDAGCSLAVIALARGCSRASARHRAAIASAQRVQAALTRFHSACPSLALEVRRLRRRGVHHPQLARIHRLLLSGQPISLICQRTSVPRGQVIQIRSALLAAGGPTAALLSELPRVRR